MQSVIKGIAGATAAAVGSTVTYISIPADVAMPWWGYVLVGFANAGLGFLVVYLSPRNRE
jgi:hypothetical protein